jgi:mRNA-degrading endonuclease RelE of RelBE toxin-antitoxin system
MDRIRKFLQRLTPEERDRITNVMVHIVKGKYGTIDVKKMKGYGNLYRARVGNIRIIFIEQGNTRRIIAVARRDDRTYSDL